MLVEYNYDPWGKITCTYLGEGEGEDQATLQMATAILCPLTYRGYNYDFITGLYYLQSRYYNPEWGRFLNCDDTSILLATQGETHGANMFAYCGNDPINNIDPTGMLFKAEKEWREGRHNAFLLVAGLSFAMFYDSIKINVDDDISRKGVIHIQLGDEKLTDGKKCSFSDMLFEIYKDFDGDLFDNDVFEALALAATDKFYNEFDIIFNKKYNNAKYGYDSTSKREFLFSDSGVADEIKQHCLGYWQSQNKLSFFEYSVRMNVAKNLLKADLKKRCESIDIAEKDVATFDDLIHFDIVAFDDAVAFQYYYNIRSTYLFTNADPYYYSIAKRRTPIPRPGWETGKIQK